MDDDPWSLAALEKAFFRPRSRGSARSANSATSEPEAMDDYRLVKVDPPPRPPPELLPKYPKFDKSTIRHNVPGVF